MATVVATVPIPLDWPEQRVKLVKQDISEEVRVEYRSIDPGLRQMVVRFPKIPDGEELHAILTLQVPKYSLAAPGRFLKFRIAKSPPAAVKKYLQPSPLIESQNGKIREFVKERPRRGQARRRRTIGWQTVEHSSTPSARR